MSQKVKTLIKETSDIDGICASQTIATGLLAINGALAAGMSAANILTLTMTNDQTGATFTIIGKAYGVPIREVVTGVNGSTVNTVQYFDYVSSITVGGTVTGASTITVGHTTTNGYVSGIIMFDSKHNCDYKSALSVVIGGTATYTVQYTLGEIQELDSNGYSNNLTWFNHGTMAGYTVSATGNFFFQVTGCRLLATASTGTTTLTVRE